MAFEGCGKSHLLDFFISPLVGLAACGLFDMGFFAWKALPLPSSSSSDSLASPPASFRLLPASHDHACAELINKSPVYPVQREQDLLADLSSEEGVTYPAEVEIFRKLQTSPAQSPSTFSPASSQVRQLLPSAHANMVFTILHPSM